MGHRSFECKGKAKKVLKKDARTINTLGDEIFQPFPSRVQDELHFKMVKINSFEFKTFFVDEQFDDWLKEGIIQQSSSNYASSVVVVPKNDG
ncbi:unnamed protein product, partial [Ceratitis capitata]